MFRNIFSTVPFVLCSLMAPEAAAGGGSPAPASAPEPQGNTLEEKLVSATKIIKDYFSQLAGAMSERDAAVTQVTALTGERDGAIQARDGFKTQVDTLTSDVGRLTSLNTGLATERDTARNRVTLIESFAKGKGLDLTGIEKHKAAPEVPEGGQTQDGKALYDEWQNLKKDKPAKAQAFFRKHRAELMEYKDSLGG